MTSTRVQLCGRFVVDVEGRRLEGAFPGRQGRLLFAYLALNRDRPVPRSELVEALWSSELPRDPSDALAAVLSKLRAAVGNHHIEGRSEITLVLPPDAHVDVERAIASAHEAESACSLGDWHRAWGASLCTQTIGRRTLLGDYEAAWIDAWRRTLDDARLRALECYGRACLELGGTELAAAERAAREVIRLAPLRESAYGLLMESLEASGNVAEALLVYEELRQKLREELGIAPTELAQAEYRRLLGAPARG
ncbi:MAG TPA: BTAD domain-containing putative transcriptional regulator [Thermoleophilaceae bacterium]